MRKYITEEVGTDCRGSCKPTFPCHGTYQNTYFIKMNSIFEIIGIITGLPMLREGIWLCEGFSKTERCLAEGDAEISGGARTNARCLSVD